MKTGAVIVAAGMSTRMQQFKQLMKIGNRTMAERVVVNFRQAGVEEIVMVTGYRSQQLEKELQGFGVTFLKNNQYQTTEMFDSAKIGLEYLCKRCEKVLFCPVDIPFFLEKTVALLLAQQGDIIQPVYQKRGGHPILIQSALIPAILSYQGQGGLKGALSSLGNIKRVRVPVEDEAVLMDADTREDFQRLADLHNARLMHPDVKVTLVNQKPFFDEMTLKLLQNIMVLGSVREACEQLGISYSKGFHIIQAAEDGMGYRIVERQPGGCGGGTAAITERGMRMIELYAQYQKQVAKMAEEQFANIFLSSDSFLKNRRWEEAEHEIDENRGSDWASSVS